MNDLEDLRRVQERMQPGVITLDGFLGDDTRDLAEIISEDDQAVRALGITHQQIAERLAHFTALAYSGYGTPRRENDFEAVVSDTRGWLRCPFGHRGRFRKGEVRLRNLHRGEILVWTPIQVHLIAEHGFYEGKGGHYRMEPEQAKKMFELHSFGQERCL